MSSLGSRYLAVSFKSSQVQVGLYLRHAALQSGGLRRPLGLCYTRITLTAGICQAVFAPLTELFVFEEGYMASPFTVFRKNQKVLLAVTGILAMIAFVFLGTCIQSTGPAQASSNPTVVSWNFGEIYQSEMDDRLTMRRILNRFILEAMAISGQRTDVQPPFSETERDIVHAIVLARRGREMGLIITDEMVNRMLAQLTNNRVRPADFERITASFKQSGSRGQRVTSTQIFDALREELLARHVAMLFLDGLGISPQDAALDPPAQRWDYFRRFERRVTGQVLGVPVAKFTDKVKAPSEQELQNLYEKHKDQFSSPASPDPGFRQPYRARFQYFQASVDDVVTSELDRVTDEQIQEYYEKNKATQFRASTLPSLDLEDSKKDAAESTDSKASDQNGKKADAKKVGPESQDLNADEAKKDDAKKGSDDATGAKKDAAPAGDKADDTKQGADAKATENDAKAAGPDQGKTSQRDRASRFRFVNFQEGKSKELPAKSDKADTTDAGKTADAAKGTSTSDAADRNEDKAAAKANSVVDESAKDKANEDAASKEPATKTESVKEETGKKDAEKDQTKADPVEYRPLEKVRDEIRRTLARDRAQTEIDKRFTELRIAMSRYADQRMRWQIASAKDPQASKPKPLDMDALAKEHGVKAFSTDMLSVLEVESNSELGIGKSRDMNIASRTTFYQPWLQIVFQPKGLYRPLTTVDSDGNSYLSWKIEEREGHIPTFKEARTDVLEAYKQIKARDFAKQEAEKYAKTVREAKQPMKEVFAQDKDLLVKDIGPFAWLTRPNVPFGMQQSQGIQMTPVPGVETPGEDFMRAIFSLEAGGVGVAFNFPKSVVYVIQATDFEPRESVLEQEFMVRMQNYNRYRGAGSGELAGAQSLWLESLIEEYGVVWHRTADEYLENQE